VRARSLAFRGLWPGLIRISDHQAMSVNTAASKISILMASSQIDGLWIHSQSDRGEVGTFEVGQFLEMGGGDEIVLRSTVDAVAAKPHRAGAR